MEDENTGRVLGDFVDSYDSEILYNLAMNSELDDLPPQPQSPLLESPPIYQVMVPSVVPSRQSVLVPQYPKSDNFYNLAMNSELDDLPPQPQSPLLESPPIYQVMVPSVVPSRQSVLVPQYPKSDNFYNLAMNSELDDLPPQPQSPLLEPPPTYQMALSRVPSRPQVLVPQNPPKHWEKCPSITPMMTAYGFKIKPADSENTDWCYDHHTKKLFTKPNTVMSVDVSCVAHGEIDLYMRVMAVNKAIDFINHPIARCDNHRSQNITAYIQDVPRAHLVICHNPLATYVGNEYAQKFIKRLAVIVPLSGEESTNENGTMNETMQLQFTCKNSCAKGVKRKKTELIFTLENKSGEILGRQVMQYKVCGAPIRDMKNEIKTRTTRTTIPSERESENPRKRKSTKQPMRESKTVSRGKKPCTIVRPAEISAQPVPPAISSRIVRQSYKVTITMPSKESADHVYECARNAVAGEQLRDVQNPPPGYYEGLYRTIDIGRQSLDTAIPIINSFN